jgi:copper(I)-binding protein
VIRTGWGIALPRRLVLVAAAALIPVLAGCEAGNNAPTLEFHPPTDAASASVGQLTISNVFVVGAPLGFSLHKGQSASLYLALINDGPSDTLTSISAPGTAASIPLPAGGIPVRFHHPVLLTGPKPAVYLTSLTRSISGGTDIKLVLTFRNAGPVTLFVPVMARAAHYVTYGTPPSPTASPTPSATPTGHHRATPSRTATPGLSTTPTPHPTA